MFPENLKPTSGLSILMHGVFALPDTTSYDNKKKIKTHCQTDLFHSFSRVWCRMQSVKTVTTKQVNYFIYGQ